MDRELVYNDELTARKWALNSAVECHLHTVEVIGSNPIAPTIFIKGLRGICPKIRSTVRSTQFIESSPKPFPIPSGTPLARPEFHRHRLGVDIQRRLDAALTQDALRRFGLDFSLIDQPA